MTGRLCYTQLVRSLGDLIHKITTPSAAPLLAQLHPHLAALGDGIQMDDPRAIATAAQAAIQLLDQLHAQQPRPVITQRAGITLIYGQPSAIAHAITSIADSLDEIRCTAVSADDGAGPANHRDFSVAGS